MIIFRIISRIRAWRFARGLGRIAKAYRNLTQQTDKAALMMREFGKEWMDVQPPTDEGETKE